MGRQRITHLVGPGRFALEVHGESHYDKNLHHIAGKRRGDEPVHAPALLVAENGNRHDRNAIRVEIDGRTVGYVPAELSAGMRYALQARKISGVVECAAEIRGGQTRGKQRLFYGVWLDMPDDLIDDAVRAPRADVANPKKKKRACCLWPF